MLRGLSFTVTVVPAPKAAFASLSRQEERCPVTVVKLADPPGISTSFNCVSSDASALSIAEARCASEVALAAIFFRSAPQS